MNELTIEWQETGHTRRQIIRDQQLSKNTGTVRLGRDPLRCDIVLTHPTVSGLHVEIFFNPYIRQFFLRNLRQSNPPWVNGNRLTVYEVILREGTIFNLGETQIKVTAIAIEPSPVPPTLLISTLPTANANQALQGQNQNQYPPYLSPLQPALPPASNQTYGLQCPNVKCGRVSPYEQLDLGCPWCGTSLAAAASVLMTPSHS